MPSSTTPTMSLRDLLLRFPNYLDLHAMANDPERLARVAVYTEGRASDGVDTETVMAASVLKRAFENATNVDCPQGIVFDMATGMISGKG